MYTSIPIADIWLSSTVWPFKCSTCLLLGSMCIWLSDTWNYGVHLVMWLLQYCSYESRIWWQLTEVYLTDDFCLWWWRMECKPLLENDVWKFYGLPRCIICNSNVGGPESGCCLPRFSCFLDLLCSFRLMPCEDHTYRVTRVGDFCP